MLRRSFLKLTTPFLAIPLTFAAAFFGNTTICVAQAAVAEAEDATEDKAAESAELPSAKQIMDDHLAAVGGRENFEKIKSLVLKGELEIAAIGAKADLEVYQTDANQFLFRTTIPQIGEIKKCVNGELAWDMNPVMGTRIIDGEELKSLQREADIAAPLHPDKYFKNIECVGTEEINGSKCYRLEFETHEGKTETAFYDSKTKMVVRIKRKQLTPMGEIEMTANMSDFRESGGFTFPFLTETTYMGQKEVMKIKTVEANAEVDPAVFETPAEVQELVEKDKMKAAEKDKENADGEKEAAEDDGEEG